jgi:hypothetical protein
MSTDNTQVTAAAEPPTQNFVRKNEWRDISSEVYREYIYADYTLRINQPWRLFVKESSLGGHAHRVETADGMGYYVAPGWKAICWKAKDSQQVFQL